MGLKLYFFPNSPPARTTLLTIHALGLENQVEIQIIDVFKGEQRTDEFLKLNPMHKIPVLVDNGFVVYESAAISVYLVEKYGKGDDLYPKDLQKKAIVNQMLHYVSGTIFPAWQKVVFPMYFQGATTVSEDTEKRIYEVYSQINKILEATKYAAGNEMTVADFHFGIWVTTMQIVFPLDALKYPKLSRWVQEISSLPYFDKSNRSGHESYTKVIKSKLTDYKPRI